jgi:tetratricopeptide (TPR) repeat protein
MASADIAALHADIGNAQALNNARLIARSTPNARQRDVALSYVAGVQAQSGDVRGALATSNAIKDGTSKAYALTRIAGARTDSPDEAAIPQLLERALSTARRAKPTGATPAVLCEIAHSYILLGDLAQARSALDHAYTIATSKRGLRYSAATVEKIARLRARTGDIAGALTISAGVHDGSARALLVHDILAVQAEKDDVRGAIRTAETLGDARLQVAALFGIVGVQMTNGDVQGARASLKRVLELTRDTADAGFRSHSLGAVAAAQVELGDRTDAWPNFQEALAAAAAVPDTYARAFAYVNVADPFTERP